MLDDSTYKIQFRRGLEAEIPSEDDYGIQGEPAYATDTETLYIHNGTEYKKAVQGASGSFTSQDGKTITVVDGVITGIA